MRTAFILLAVSVVAALAGCNCDSSAPCCSQYGYCGSTADYCDAGKGCKSGCWGSSGDGGSGGSGSYGPIDKQDRYGGDMPNGQVTASSASACQKQCHNTQGCVAWAYDSCGKVNCWLKSSEGTSTPNSCRRSGVLSGSNNSTSSGGSTSGGSSSTSGGSTSGGGTTSSGLTDCQQEIIFRVTSVFETGSPNLSFDFCDYESDGQGYDAGFMSATSHSGAILGIVQLYCKTNSGDSLCGIIPALQKAVGSSTKNGLGNLCSAWKAASGNKAFRNAQWQYTVDNYFSPATQHAKQIGLTSPLGLGQLYDTNIQLGDGDDKNSLGGIINTVNGKVGKPAQAGQTNWVSAFLAERTNAENRIGGAYPGTLYRVRSYKHVIDKGQADMTGRTVEFLDNSGNAMQVTCSGNLH